MEWYFECIVLSYVFADLWLSELTIAVNANNGARAHQMVERLMQYPKHVGQVALSGTCQEKKKELPCDSSEDCIR